MIEKSIAVAPEICGVFVMQQKLTDTRFKCRFLWFCLCHHAVSLSLQPWFLFLILKCPVLKSSRDKYCIHPFSDVITESHTVGVLSTLTFLDARFYIVDWLIISLLYEIKIFSLFTVFLYPYHLDQFLAHNKCSMNIYQVDDWMNKWW